MAGTERLTDRFVKTVMGLLGIKAKATPKRLVGTDTPLVAEPEKTTPLAAPVIPAGPEPQKKTKDIKADEWPKPQVQTDSADAWSMIEQLEAQMRSPAPEVSPAPPTTPPAQETIPTKITPRKKKVTPTPSPAQDPIPTKIALRSEKKTPVKKPSKRPESPKMASKMDLMLDQKKKKRRRSKRLSPTARKIARTIEKYARTQRKNATKKKIAERLTKRLLNPPDESGTKGPVIKIPQGSAITVSPPGIQPITNPISGTLSLAKEEENIEEGITIAKGALQSLERDYFKHLLSVEDYKKRSADLLGHLRELEEKKKIRETKTKDALKQPQRAQGLGVAPARESPAAGPTLTPIAGQNATASLAKPRTMPVVLTRSVGTPQGPVAGSPTGAQPFSRADQDAALAPKRSTKPSASTKDPRPDTETILSKATPQASKAQLAPAQGKEPERIMRAKIMVDNITAKTISIPAGGFRDQPPKTVYVPMYVQAPPVAQATATPPLAASFIPGALTDRFRIGSNAPRGQPKTTTAASNSANNAPAQARNAPVLAQAPIVVNISQDAPRNRTHYYTAEEADKPQVRDTSIPRPDFSGRNLDQEYAQAQVHAAHEKEQERLDIAQVKQAIQDNFRGKVDDRQLKELTDNVQRLLESHSIQTDFIKERLAHADSSQILDSFMAMVRMIEEQRPKTETIQMVPEEFKNYRPNLKKEAPKAESRELENKELITDYDKILEVVRSKGKISVDTLAKNAQIDKKALREILSVLEKEELIDVQYPPFGSPVVIDLLAKRKKEGKE